MALNGVIEGDPGCIWHKSFLSLTRSEKRGGSWIRYPSSLFIERKRRHHLAVPSAAFAQTTFRDLVHRTPNSHSYPKHEIPLMLPIAPIIPPKRQAVNHTLHLSQSLHLLQRLQSHIPLNLVLHRVVWLKALILPA